MKLNKELLQREEFLGGMFIFIFLTVVIADMSIYHVSRGTAMIHGFYGSFVTIGLALFVKYGNKHKLF